MRPNQQLLSALVRKARRDRAREDIEFFAEYYLGHIMSDKKPAFHIEIRNLLMTEKRIGIAAPRGFAKSTNVQIIYAMYCLLFNEQEDILTISQSAEMADDWIRKIKFEFEGNEKIKEDFGGLLLWGEEHSKRWTGNHLIIQIGNRIFSQIRARGSGCQVRGLRPTKVICDDLENEEMVRSDDQRKFMKEWFFGAVLNVLKMDQQIIFIGTILHPLSLIAEIIGKKNQFSKWETRKYIALSEDGKSLWPERFPVSDLMRRKQEIGTYAFEAEFQNNPIASDTCLWKPEWIKKYNPAEVKPVFIRKFAALDLAASERTAGDYSALCCIGETEDGRFYEIETIRGHWGIWDLVMYTIDFYMRHKPLRLGIEEQSVQNIIRPVLQREAQKKGISLPIESLSLGSWSDSEKKSKSPKDKRERAFSVIHFWENGQVYFKTQDLIDEVSIFPTGSHDDMVDTVVYCMRMFLKYGAKSVVFNEEKQIIRANSFEIRDDFMPNLAAIDEQNLKNLGPDWRVG